MALVSVIAILALTIYNAYRTRTYTYHAYNEDTGLGRLAKKRQEKSYMASRHVQLIAAVGNVINVQISKKTGVASLAMVAISASTITLDHCAALVKIHTVCHMMLTNV